LNSSPFSATMNSMNQSSGTSLNFTKLPPLNAKSGNKKTLLIILILVFFVIAVLIGVYLVSQRQTLQTPAQTIEELQAEPTPADNQNSPPEEENPPPTENPPDNPPTEPPSGDNACILEVHVTCQGCSGN